MFISVMSLLYPAARLLGINIAAGRRGRAISLCRFSCFYAPYASNHLEHLGITDHYHYLLLE